MKMHSFSSLAPLHWSQQEIVWNQIFFVSRQIWAELSTRNGCSLFLMRNRIYAPQKFESYMSCTMNLKNI